MRLCKRIHNALRMAEVVGRGREALVDDLHLVGVYSQLATEAFSASVLYISSQGFHVFEIHRQGVNRLHLGMGRG